MNIYLQKILDRSKPNKYAKWYTSIVEKALSRSSDKKTAKKLLGYVEGHHIFPNKFCNDNESKDKLNYVFLTAKEHFIAHRLLPKMLVDFDMVLSMREAANMMTMVTSLQGRYRISSRTCEFMKREAAEAKSLRMTGGTISTEHLAAIKNAITGVPRSEETKAKISRANKGRKLSEAFKQRCRDNNPMFRPDVRSKLSQAKYKNYILTTPEGEELNLDTGQIIALCEEKNIDYFKLRDCKYRNKSHNGWTMKDA